MTFRGACIISVLAHRQLILQAPLLFLWIIVIHEILRIALEPITMLLIGAIITVYQQLSSHIEDRLDGFFDHCVHNGPHLAAYSFAKSITVWIGTPLPMTSILIVLGIGLSKSIIMLSQWMTLSVCIAYIITIAHDSNPLKLLLGWLPLLATPFIFLVNFLQTMNGNSLLILLGCDIILVSTVCILLIFQKSQV